jgi:nucleoredoxin
MQTINTILSKDLSELQFPIAETTLLYFSAHWCPPCKVLTPILAEFYGELRAEGVSPAAFEVVFVSSDRSEPEFKEYYQSMPWAHLRFSNREEKNRISSFFAVNTIPKIVVLNHKGVQIQSDARQLITKWYSSITRDSASSVLASIQAISN